MKKILYLALLSILTISLTEAQERPQFTKKQLNNFGELDFNLKKKIVGTWYFESIGRNTVHAGQRITYFDDSTFVSDYRISSAGSIRHKRSIGIWYCLMGWFSEEITKASDNKTPYRLVRWVEKSDDDVLKVESRFGSKASLIRGDAVPEDFNAAIDKLDEKQLDKDLIKQNMLGYISQKTGEKNAEGNELVRWILKSNLMGQ